MRDPRPLIVHLVYRLDVGGLENGVVNLINRLSQDSFRHAVVALTECSPEFCARVRRDDVQFISLHKPPGHGIRLYCALYRLFRELMPAIVHTRNLAALEAVVPAWVAGVPVRIHGEHGWDVLDPDGRSTRFRLIRKIYRPFVTEYVALSAHLVGYLRSGVGLAEKRVTRICNGVDTVLFSPAPRGRELVAGSPFNASQNFVVGTVGRLQAVKDQLNLIHAFSKLAAVSAEIAQPMRLIIVGDGAMRGELEAEAARLGVADRIWFAGERHDIPDLMRAMDVFVLPSQAEGISNTILEAMACGLPVIATNVGGNPELVIDGETGALVKARDSDALAAMLLKYAEDRTMARMHGLAGRRRVEAEFSIETMISRYAALYASHLETVGRSVLAN